ncbi:MAG: hypothetical protein ACRDVE_15685 [Actinocrinis sp.]
MTMPVPGGLAPLPSAEKVVTAFLAARAELEGVSVGDRLPDGYDGSQPCVTVERIGGPADPSTMSWLDTAQLDLSSYGVDKGAADGLSAIVRYLIAIAKYVDLPDAVITKTEENVGPQWLADATADYPQSGRYLLQAAVTLHPATS